MMINVQTVAVIGSGTMGAGIAEVAASHGHQVLLYDISAEALTRAIDGDTRAAKFTRDAGKTDC